MAIWMCRVKYTLKVSHLSLSGISGRDQKQLLISILYFLWKRRGAGFVPSLSFHATVSAMASASDIILKIGRYNNIQMPCHSSSSV